MQPGMWKSHFWFKGDGGLIIGNGISIAQLLCKIQASNHIRCWPKECVGEQRLKGLPVNLSLLHLSHLYDSPMHALGTACILATMVSIDTELWCTGSKHCTVLTSLKTKQGSGVSRVGLSVEILPSHCKAAGFAKLPMPHRWRQFPLDRHMPWIAGNLDVLCNAGREQCNRQYPEACCCILNLTQSVLCTWHCARRPVQLMSTMQPLSSSWQLASKMFSCM